MSCAHPTLELLRDLAAPSRPLAADTLSPLLLCTKPGQRGRHELGWLGLPLLRPARS